MKRSHPLLFVAALLCVLPAAAQDAEPTSLRPSWEVGRTTTYEFWSKTQKTEDAVIFDQPQNKTTTFYSEGQASWTVDRVNDDGSALCTMKLLKMKFTAEYDGQEPLVLDSENPEGDGNVFDSLLSAMVSTPLTITMKPDGTVESIEGVDALQAAAGQEAQDADVIPEELDFIESATEMATLLSAPEQATVGQTWNAKNTWNHESVIPNIDTKADWDTTYTFASLGQIAGVPIATIKSESRVELKPDLSDLPEGASDVDIRFDSVTATGEALYDLSRNEVVARNKTMTYHATIDITPPTDRVPPIQVKMKETSVSQLLRIAEE